MFYFSVGFKNKSFRIWTIHQGSEGKDGKPGVDGTPGRDGKDGNPGFPGLKTIWRYLKIVFYETYILEHLLILKLNYKLT